MNVTVANSGMSEDDERSLIDLATVVIDAVGASIPL